MPTIAQTTKEKRLISELFSDEGTRSKKQRVRFDDHVEFLSEDEDSDEEEEEEDVEFVLSIGDDGDFDYTIITSTASAAASASTSYQPSQEDIKKLSSPPSSNHAKITRPASPFAGSDRRLCEELYNVSSASEDGSDCCPSCDEGVLNNMMMLLPSFQSSNYHYSPLRSSLTSWQSSLGNDLKIFIPSSSSSDEDDTMTSGAKGPPYHAALLTPLITPPPTPRRDVSSSNGGNSDETVICEWPCNLTVDNAITSALELPPLR